MRALIDAIIAKDNPSVVGLDPKPALIPPILLNSARTVRDVAEAYFAFNIAIIDAVYDIVPAVKPQIAMYEALGPAGLDVYVRTNEYAQTRGLYVLGDIKRGDIGSTAAAYAAHIEGTPSINGVGSTDVWHEDAVTVNPYLGSDGILPFVQAANNSNKDIFVLVKTSNPSSNELQDLRVDGSAHTVATQVAELVEQWGENSRDNKYGYSRVGAVVGATHPVLGAQLRTLMPHTFFLVPGYGAQGGTADDLAGLFDENGLGALINSSRGIIGAWKHTDEAETIRTKLQALNLVATSARQAALAMKNDIARVRA
ncbi:orotidine-5'-phosphate decarboxylase [Alloscardovia omnicolens]|uniref:orotidine-5'-phosphate decarboxylase n=1 Tax=Alloscardovia omnicolens TaxID=419015 RepID=UPI0028EEA5F8|nr:orotidine-5'-phosphate decarboxylase [Alloscardovia omnicolens]MDU3533255.1 orotidine-5'-phosphate decarboxylase [Alloscardovia omnicolens]